MSLTILNLIVMSAKINEENGYYDHNLDMLNISN